MATDVQAIKDKVDIVELVGEYVQLKSAGTNHKGLCPFHHEKSPSFMVHRDRQFWHCFGCGKGGDIFTFIQEMEGMEFVEALKLLAARAGVPLESLATDTNSSQKNRIKEINSAAARFFHEFLLRMDSAKDARDYLVRRGVKMETVEEWQIGFVPDQWDLLTKYLLKKGFSIDDLVAAGLTAMRDGANKMNLRGFYDRFRGRIMFPLWDVHGTIVGFTGRILVETENSGGKYVNTPQTPVYDKSRVVFGLNKAKQIIKTQDCTVMVEGQMDVIACHQAGMKNVVATSGTAMTEEQIRLLKRYSSNLKIAFDADAAGQNAADRGIDVALGEGMNISVITIPEGQGKDADECLKLHPDVWFQAVTNARPIMEYYFGKAFAGKATLGPRDKQLIADLLLPKIGRIPYAVERDHWLRQLADRLTVDVSVLREDLQRLQRSTAKLPGSPSHVAVPTPAPRAVPVEKTRIATILERFWALCLKYPSVIRELRPDIEKAAVLSTGKYAGLYEIVKRGYTTGIPFTIESLRNVDSADNLNTIDLLLLRGEKEFSQLSEGDVRHEASQLLRMAHDEWVRDERRRLQQEIAQAETAGDMNRLRDLIMQLQQLVV